MNKRGRVRYWTMSAGALLIAVSALAQQSTERYIPIGASPGVSNESSYIGRIVSIAGRQTLTIEAANGEQHTLTVTADTPVWLDRSGQSRANTVGSYADCQVGRRAEIMPRPAEPGLAAWIKVEAP